MALLTAQELATELRVTVDTVWRYTRNGRIPSVRLGPRDYRYSLPEVLTMLGAAAREKMTDADPAAAPAPALQPADPLALRSFAGKTGRDGGG